MEKEKIATLWNKAAENPQTEKVRGYYLTRLFLIPIEKARKYNTQKKDMEQLSPSKQGNKKVKILKVDVWNEGVDFERNILKHLKNNENKLYGVDISLRTCILAKENTKGIEVSNGTID